LSDFDEFWSLYPKKIGKNAARKSWNKIRPNIEAVIQALTWQKQSKQWFEKGGQFSMHFHKDKMETWYVQSGQFEVEVINTVDASVTKKILHPGSVHHNDPLIPHRVTCLEAGTIIEVSTADSVEDNYRILPGDSQP
jgi:mannose-6-phosphate isomerase-like protein (cupin superfamily)